MQLQCSHDAATVQLPCRDSQGDMPVHSEYRDSQGDMLVHSKCTQAGSGSVPNMQKKASFRV